MRSAIASGAMSMNIVSKKIGALRMKVLHSSAHPARFSPKKARKRRTTLSAPPLSIRHMPITAARAIEMAMSRAVSPSPFDTISTTPTIDDMVFTLPSFCTMSHVSWSVISPASIAARIKARKACRRSTLMPTMMKATLTARTTKGQ